MRAKNFLKRKSCSENILRTILAQLVFILHILSIAFFTLGWLLPMQWLIVHICSVPLVILQWKFNNDQCVLTQVQLKLEGKVVESDEQGQFIKGLFEKINLNLSHTQLFLVIYGLLFFSLFLSVYRLWL